MKDHHNCKYIVARLTQSVDISLSLNVKTKTIQMENPNHTINDSLKTKVETRFW